MRKIIRRYSLILVALVISSQLSLLTHAAEHIEAEEQQLCQLCHGRDTQADVLPCDTIVFSSPSFPHSHEQFFAAAYIQGEYSSALARGPPSRL